MGFSREEYWSGGSLPLAGGLPDPGIKPVFLMLPALGDGFFTTSPTWGFLGPEDPQKGNKESGKQDFAGTGRSSPQISPHLA